MKKVTLKFVGMIMLLSAPLFMMESCTTDPCKDVVCENSGTPTENGDNCNCVCTVGYVGTTCQTETRSQYVGTYKVSGTAASGGNSATITDLIVTVANSSASVEKINISYTIGGDTYSLVASFTDASAFTLASQTAQGLTYSGSGSFTASSMTIQLVEVDGTDTTNINLTGPKQ